jgi:hypothetical protein
MCLKLKGEKTIDDRVNEQMSPENIRIETQVDGKWKPVKG